MITLLAVGHVIISILLILVVLLQSGKGSDIGSVFGGGASQTLFGTGGSKTILTKITTVLAVLFMLTSFLLATLPNKRKVSAIQKELQKEGTINKESKQLPAQTGTQVPVSPQVKPGPEGTGSQSQSKPSNSKSTK